MGNINSKKLYIIGLFLFVNIHLFAQDYTFSQYNFTPLNINPGIIPSEENTSFIFNQRNQKYINNLAFKTLQFAASHTFLHPKKNNNGLAIAASNDQISTGGLFRHQTVSLAFAQSIKISGKSFLSLGMQTEYNQKNIETENYTTGSQWIENVGFNPLLGSGELITNENVTFFNLNTGLYWYMPDEGQGKKSYAGISLYNINRPNGSFLSHESKIPLKTIANAGYTVFKSKNFSVTPEALYINYNTAHFASLGSSCSYSFKNSNPFLPVSYGSLDVGTKYLTNKSVSLSLQVFLENFAFGISHDMGINAQKNNYPVGGITEFVFAYKKNFRKKVEVKRTDENYEVGQIREFYTKDFSEDFKADVKEQVITQDTTKSYRVELKKDFKFGFNEATLNDDAKVYLDDLANLMKSDQDLKLEIIGHTDNVGTEKANLKISKLRAEIVAGYLTEQGIDKKRLKTIAKGDSDPVFPNNTSSNRAKNRRVEFVIYK